MSSSEKEAGTDPDLVDVDVDADVALLRADLVVVVVVDTIFQVKSVCP